VNYSIELERRGKGKDNDCKSTISEYIASVYLEDITKCTESCRIIRVRRDRVKKNIRYG
jgi:hypothetical protein